MDAALDVGVVELLIIVRSHSGFQRVTGHVPNSPRTAPEGDTGTG